MTNETITSSGAYSTITLSSTLSNGENVEFLNNGGTEAGVLILTDNPQGSAFNIITYNSGGTITGYGANIGGQIMDFAPGHYGLTGDQVTIQAVKDLFAELFVGGTTNTDYINLVNDITTAAENGSQFLILPNGTVETTVETFFTLDTAQKLVIGEVATALFGTHAAAAGATLDISFSDARLDPNSNSHFIDAVFTTENTTVNPCFAAGTRILTPEGEVAVETLQPGDLVLTQNGEEQPIIWAGQRRLNLATHPNPASVRPIIIEAGALADHVPARRLILSPDHALLIDGVLVPAKDLLNWSTVRQDQSLSEITYHHLELATHGIIFAENTPAETFLDTGHRNVFDNAPSNVVTHPATMQHRRATQSCAPLCTSGPTLANIRHRIATRQIGIRLGGG